MGVLALADPPREDSAETISAAKELGVEVKMVTGDQVAIGREIARQVGLGDRIVDAAGLDGSTVDGELAAKVAAADGFAQVFPEHKFRIVRLLQSDGHIVGMTGDGVNDAPALKQADAGDRSGWRDRRRPAPPPMWCCWPQVVGDRHRDPAGSRIFARMTSYATYRIAETIRILLLITLSIVFVNFFPVTAVMIVLLALLNDGAILTIAYDRVRGATKPAAWDMRGVLTVATALGLAGAAATFLLFLLADKVWGLDRDVIRTLIYLKLSVAGHLTVSSPAPAARSGPGPAPRR